MFFQTVDVCVSIVSFFHCLMASIVLAIYTCSRCDELIAADVFGFLLCIAYAVEIYFLKGNAPSSLSKLPYYQLMVVFLACPLVMLTCGFLCRIPYGDQRYIEGCHMYMWVHHVCHAGCGRL